MRCCSVGVMRGGFQNNVTRRGILIELEVKSHCGAGDEERSDACFQERLGQGAERLLVDAGECDARADGDGREDLELADGDEDAVANGAMLQSRAEAGARCCGLCEEFDEGGGKQKTVGGENVIGGDRANGGRGQAIAGEGCIIEPVHGGSVWKFWARGSPPVHAATFVAASADCGTGFSRSAEAIIAWACRRRRA